MKCYSWYVVGLRVDSHLKRQEDRGERIRRAGEGHTVNERRRGRMLVLGRGLKMLEDESFSPHCVCRFLVLSYYSPLLASM